MAQVPGFEYDIFISYTHNDNHSPTDAPGWVDRFHDELESWLKFRRGKSKLTIWRDKALDGNTEFNLSIKNKIKNSALFFVLNSQNYRQSDYCRKELKWFHQHHGSRPGGLIVGEHHRIFNILLRNIPHLEWPEELGKTSGFSMNDAQSPEELGDFTSPKDDRFQKQLRRIVDAVEATLDEFSKLNPTLEDRETHDHDVTIFVADVADSLQDFRERIIAEGVEFYWQVGREELEFKRQVKPNLYPQDGYHFKFKPKFRPLLKPPVPGQGKFDQILEWAKGQLKKGQ